MDVGESYVQALPRIDSGFEQWVGTSSPAREQARHLPSRSDNAATPLSPREGSKEPKERKGPMPDPTSVCSADGCRRTQNQRLGGA